MVEFVNADDEPISNLSFDILNIVRGAGEIRTKKREREKEKKKQINFVE